MRPVTNGWLAPILGAGVAHSIGCSDASLRTASWHGVAGVNNRCQERVPTRPRRNRLDHH